MQLISDTVLIVELTDAEGSRIRKRRKTWSVRNTVYQGTCIPNFGEVLPSGSPTNANLASEVKQMCRLVSQES